MDVKRWGRVGATPMKPNIGFNVCSGASTRKQASPHLHRYLLLSNLLVQERGRVHLSRLRLIGLFLLRLLFQGPSRIFER